MAFISFLILSIVVGQTLCTIQPTTVALQSTCTYNGKTYNEGSFRPSPCEHCFCRNGRAMCAIADCAPPPCVDAVHHADQCCSVCPNGQNCQYKGHTIKQGESYHPDSLTVCRCPDNPFHFGFGGLITLTRPCRI